jgi:thymidylate kinase
MDSKGKVIIVEGMDLAGKSTLVELIGKRYRGFIIKDTTRPKDGSREEIRKKMNMYSSVFGFINQNENQIVILDRYYPSELVYSAKRGYESFDNPDIWEFEKYFKLLDKPVYMIICQPPIETIIDRYAERGDDHIVLEDIAMLHDRYTRFINETKLEKILVLDTRNDPQDLLIAVINFIEKNEYKRDNEPKQGTLFGGQA